MAKIQNISDIHPTLGFTEFDILEKYRKSFNESELGRLHSVFPFEVMVKNMGLSENRLGRRNIFSPSAKIAIMVLKAYTGLSDRHLVEHLNGNLHYQMFCGIIPNPLSFRVRVSSTEKLFPSMAQLCAENRISLYSIKSCGLNLSATISLYRDTRLSYCIISFSSIAFVDFGRIYNSCRVTFFAITHKKSLLNKTMIFCFRHQDASCFSVYI